ncbi:MAG: cytochrome c oxidase subunit II [Sphingomicrobium sp.]|nr:cytochrome c oxidase subunit II [Sphingomonadales bacterium]
MRRAAPLLFLPLGACSGVQTSLGGQGVEGASFIGLFEIFLAVTGVMYVIVIAILLGGLFRRRANEGPTPVPDARHPLLRPALIGWTGLIVLGLSGLALASFLEDRTLARPGQKYPFSIQVTANQWWWDVQYQSSDVSHTVRTANELHLPVGVPVHVALKSNDVIHSFWVPNLAGKQDLIPGRTNDLVLEPTQIGQYRGQCAEFCGREHAKMAFDVTVESPAAFQAWWSAQLASAKPPSVAEAAAGAQIVTSGPCAMCHAIAGTNASASVAPDLTHLASRRSIAAGTLPMSRANLESWVADPQGHKPGSKMPKIPLDAAQLHAVSAYLASLQ